MASTLPAVRAALHTAITAAVPAGTVVTAYPGGDQAITGRHVVQLGDVTVTEEFATYRNRTETYLVTVLIDAYQAGDLTVAAAVETEAFALYDIVRDAVHADITLNGLVVAAHVAAADVTYGTHPEAGRWCRIEATVDVTADLQ